MKMPLKPLFVSMFLLCAGLVNVIHAQGYDVDAQITSQAAGGGTYNYTITVNNEGDSGQTVGMFWFAWFTYSYFGYTYDYDLLASPPTVTQMPPGWYASVVGGSLYDGYSIEFYNYYGANLTPGSSFTFKFNSPDSPDTLNQQSAYYPVPTMTSFVYNDYTMSDTGAEFVVAPAVTPPPPPPVLNASVSAGNGSFQLSFTNAPGYTFTILGTTNISLAMTNWTVLGQMTDSPPGSGSYQFTDSGAATNQTHRYYRVSWP